MNDIAIAPVSDLMNPTVETVSRDMPVGEAAASMARKKISCLVVGEGAVAQGIVTERDLLRHLDHGGETSTPLSRLMSSPVLSVPADTDFKMAYAVMRRRGIRHVLVTDAAGSLQGIVSETDLRQHIGAEILQRLSDPARLLEQDIPTVSPDDPVPEALARMARSAVDFVMVTQAGRPLGILTERDAPILLAGGMARADVSVGEVMTGDLVITGADTSLAQIVELMGRHRLRHIPAVNEAGELVGVFSQKRIIDVVGLDLLEDTLAQQEGLRGQYTSVERRLQLALDAGGLGVWEYDFTSGALECDAQVAGILGFVPTTLDDWLARVHPDERETIRAGIFDETRQDTFKVEYRMRGATQRWLSVEVSGRIAERDASGRPALSIGLIRNVTETRELENTLERQRQLLDTLIDNLPDPMWFKDTDGRYLVCNHRAASLFGLTPEDVLGKTLADLTGGQSGACNDSDLAVIESGHKVTLEQRLEFLCDGHVEEQETVKVPVFRDDGKLAGVLGISRDITRSNIRERELEANLARLAEAEHIAQLGNWELDLVSDRLSWSQQTHRIFGTDPDSYEPSLDGFVEFIHAEDRARVLASYRDSVEKHSSYEIMHRIITRNGDVRTVHERGQTRYDDRGVALTTLGTVHDITERVHAERALNARETIFSAIVEQATDAIALIDPDTMGWLEFNRAAHENLGYTREEFANMGIPDIDANDTSADIDIHIGQMLAGQKQRHVSRHRARDGSLRDVSIKTAPIEIDGRRYLAATWTDITEQLAREGQIRELSTVVEQSSNSVIITNLDGDIEYVNDALIRTSGYSREELIGRNPRMLKSVKTADETYVDLWASLTSGRSWRGEFVNQRKDGTEFLERVIVGPLLTDNGETIKYVAVQEDITREREMSREIDRYRQHLERLVEQRTAELSLAKRHAESANTAKNQFLANMSHEIRSPLAAILNLSHLIRRGGSLQRQSEWANKIETAAVHLLSIINDILDLSKIEAGRLELSKSDFSLTEVLQQVRALVEPLSAQKGLALTILAGGDIPQWLHGDQTRLRQAILNLATNAVKYTDAGSVHIRVETLHGDDEEVELRFDVTDTGIGISQEKKSRLFQPFEQLAQDGVHDRGGTGLGLVITRRLAKMMGGDVGVDSQSGQGSRFWFTAHFGVAHAPASEADTKGDIDAFDELTLRHAGARILVVDDDALLREMTVELFDGSELAMETASNGAEALERVRDADYDLVLMDMQMDVMDGLESTRRIRELPRRDRLPVLALTGNAFEETRRKCLLAGMNDFIAKPIDPDLLFAKVLEWLDLTRDIKIH